VSHTADEIARLRMRRRDRARWWWEPDGRSCPSCGKVWLRAHTAALDARPEWVTCLLCEQKRLRGDWTRQTEAAFVARVRRSSPAHMGRCGRSIRRRARESRNS
jgi:hypothetical protein